MKISLKDIVIFIIGIILLICVGLVTTKYDHAKQPEQIKVEVLNKRIEGLKDSLFNYHRYHMDTLINGTRLWFKNEPIYKTKANIQFMRQLHARDSVISELQKKLCECEINKQKKQKNLQYSDTMNIPVDEWTIKETDLIQVDTAKEKTELKNRK